MLRTLAVNTSSNVLLQVIKMALMFIMTPVIVHALGNYDYGIWALITATLGYMGLMDVGLRPTASRFAAFRRAHDDQAGLEEVLATATLFMATAAVIAALGFTGWALFAPGALSQQGGSGGRYAIVLGVIAVQVLFAFPGYIFESFLEGYQRYPLKNNVTIVNSLINAGVILTFINRTDPLILLAAANAAGKSLKYLLFTWFVQRWLSPAVRLRPSRASFSFLKELLSFGGKSFAYGATQRLTKETDKFIIAGFLGPASVVFYAIPLALTRQVTTLRMTLSHAFMPAFTDLTAKGQQKRVHSVYLNASRIVVGTLTLMLIGIVGVGADFIGVWIGQQYVADARLILPILAATAFVSLVNPFANRLLMALNEHGVMAKALPLAAVGNLVLSLALAPLLGLAGIALGTLIPMAFAHLYVLHYCCGILDMTVFDYFRKTLIPLLPPSLTAAGICLIMQRLFPMDSYVGIFTAAGAMTLGYGAIAWLASLGAEERRWLIEGSRRLRPSWL